MLADWHVDLPCRLMGEQVEGQMRMMPQTSLEVRKTREKYALDGSEDDKALCKR